MPTDDERRVVARSCDRCEYRPVCSTRRTCGDSAWCCSTYKKRIDHYALLELADEIKRKAQEYVKRFDENSGTASVLNGYASRIREALGCEKTERELQG